ncbi:hypothetical protein K501DRAFT_288577 [Backusella circina FSU 941]|nr:hypothetical protein K501DRAFT_288577 [Backusella circina FSU 941]
MSWRLWQFQRRHQEQEEKKKSHQDQQQLVPDNISIGQQQQQQEQVSIKQYISNFLSSSTHGAHEVVQPLQKHSTCSSSTSSSTCTSLYSSLSIVSHQKQEWAPTNKSILSDNKTTAKRASSYDKQQKQKQYDSTRCSQITSATQSIRMITPPLEQQTQIIKQDKIDYDDYEDDDDDDYFLSEDDDDDYFYYHKRNDTDFVNDFKKTQPRPTPRRSLLSDLIQKQCMISSNTTYCSSSNIKMQDLSQSLRDSIHRESDQEYSRKDSVVHTKKRDLQPTWLESFHGW